MLIAPALLSLPAGAQEYRIDSEQTNVIDGKLRVAVGAKIVVSAASSIPTALTPYSYLVWSVSDSSVATVSQINPWVQWVEGKKDGVVTVTFDAPDPAPPNVRASREVIVGNGVVVAVTGVPVAPPANVAAAPSRAARVGGVAPVARGTPLGRQPAVAEKGTPRVDATLARTLDSTAAVRDRSRLPAAVLEAPVASVLAPPANLVAGPIVGFADLHLHQMSNFGFGGQMLWGKAWGPPEHALRECNEVHGPGGTLDNVGRAMGEQLSGHDTHGFGTFVGWPHATTMTHQQVYETWLKRAVDGGLRLVVMYAVNNPVLCGAINRAPGRTCDDMEAVRHQVDSAKAFERHVDAQAGGPGQGWYRIVYSPNEARVVMQAGKLAVVLGTEVPGLFGCKVSASCGDTAAIRRNVEQLHAMGVRQVVPVHVMDNAFGGTAIGGDPPNFANRIWNGSFLDAYDCSASGVRFQLKNAAAAEQVALLLTTQGLSGFFTGFSFPSYPNGGHCNSRGLTGTGRVLLQSLMRQHMLVDLDHMGQKTFFDAFAMLRKANYPVLTSHSGFVPLSPDNTDEGRDKRYEANKAEWQVDSLAAGRGLISVITRQGTIGEVGRAPGSPVVNDCDNSVKTFAQAYLYALSRIRKAGVGDGGIEAVAFGSDFNGFNKQPSPRFGDKACAGNSSQKAMQTGTPSVGYPFIVPVVNARMDSRSSLGTRAWDINQDGLAHVGLFPDFIADLHNVGVSEADLRPLFNSAEAYVRLWERAEQYQYVPPKQMRATVAAVSGTEPLQIVVRAVDAQSNAPLSGNVFVLNKGSWALGAQVKAPDCTSRAQMIASAKNDPTGSGAAEKPCTGVVVVSGYTNVSLTLPIP